MSGYIECSGSVCIVESMSVWLAGLLCVGLGTLAGTLTSTMVTLPCVSLSGYFGFLAVTLPCVSFGYFGFALACSFLVFMESACHYSRECRSCSRDAVCAQ